MDKLIKKVGKLLNSEPKGSPVDSSIDPDYLQVDATPIEPIDRLPDRDRSAIVGHENDDRRSQDGIPLSASSMNQFNSPAQTIYQFNQATGVHIGNVFTLTNNVTTKEDEILSGNSERATEPPHTTSRSSSLRKKFPKTRTIDLLLKSDREIEHPELDIIATHLGEDWRSVGRDLGLSNGEIQQLHEDHFVAGIKEVIYQMLTEWKQREENPTVGQVCQVLWRRDIHREVVYKLKLDYKQQRRP